MGARIAADLLFTVVAGKISTCTPAVAYMGPQSMQGAANEWNKNFLENIVKNSAIIMGLQQKSCGVTKQEQGWDQGT